MTPLQGDACDRCKGHGTVPTVPGDYRVMVPCRKCAGTGRRGGAARMVRLAMLVARIHASAHKAPFDACDLCMEAV